MNRTFLAILSLLSFAGPALAIPSRFDAPTRLVLAAHDLLPAPVWKRVLEVRDPAGREVKRYLIFNLHNTYFSYCAKDGSRRIWPTAENPGALARAISPAFGQAATFVAPTELLASR